MKRAKLVAQVIGDNGETLEEHTVEVNLYSTAQTSDLPPEVIQGRVRTITTNIERELADSPDLDTYKAAYRKLLSRLMEP